MLQPEPYQATRAKTAIKKRNLPGTGVYRHNDGISRLPVIAMKPLRLLPFFRCLVLASMWLALSSQAAQRPWVTVGKSDILWGFTYVFSLSLQVPYGQTNIDDIKAGLVPVRFSLKWLPPRMPQEKVAAYFQDSLKKHFADAADFQRNKSGIERLLAALPATRKHDLWHIEYDPDAGTLIFVGERKVHHLVGASLNRALLNNWLNDNPVTTAQLLNRLIRLQSR